MSDIVLSIILIVSVGVLFFFVVFPLGWDFFKMSGFYEDIRDAVKKRQERREK